MTRCLRGDSCFRDRIYHLMEAFLHLCVVGLRQKIFNTPFIYLSHNTIAIRCYGALWLKKVGFELDSWVSVRGFEFWA